MFWHHGIPNDYELMALPYLLQNLQEEIARVPLAQERSALVATRGDEVEISGAVVAMQVGGHFAGVSSRRGCEM
jgi:hypothetical protein